MGKTNGVQFAKHIIHFGLTEDVRQSACYVAETVESFTAILELYTGPFSFCTEKI